jgi:hypothetical protein
MVTRPIQGRCPRGTLVERASARWSTVSILVAIVLASLAVSAASASARHAPRSPVLRARGHMLVWSRAGRHNRYKLLIKWRHRRAIALVVGRSFRPPALAGETVSYRVKAAFNESVWSNRAMISYAGGEVQLERPREEGPALSQEAPAEAPGVGVGVGQVKYRLDAASYFDRFATPAYVPWVRRHITLIKGYPPSADRYMSLFGLPVIGYRDPATEGQAPLAPSGIEDYVGKVVRDMRVGYAGVFVDDANWSPGFQPSPGPRANLANLIAAIRAADPRAVIELNSQFHDIWPLMRAGDADVARALQDVNMICKEFGVGPSAGIESAQDYAEFMQFADALHAKGIALTMTGDRRHNDAPTMEYNLATYFLINNGSDYVTGTAQTPEQWWSGFDVNLGNSLGVRERLASGVWTRRFSAGTVYAVEPQAPAQTIALGKTMHSAQWGDVSSLTLGPGQGAVLVG